jgi:hypothetical protein
VGGSCLRQEKEIVWLPQAQTACGGAEGQGFEP